MFLLLYSCVFCQDEDDDGDYVEEEEEDEDEDGGLLYFLISLNSRA